MKLFTKISLIVAAIAGGVGILAVVIGLVMGAKVEDLQQMGIYISPNQVELSGVIRNEIRDEFLDEFDEYHHIYNDRDSKHHKGVEEHNNTPNGNQDSSQNSNMVNGINRLEVDVQNADITIFSVEDTEEIQYSTNRGKEIARVEGNTLKLEEEISIKEHLELEIYIPVGVLREIEIEATNGAIKADRIVADNVSIDIDNASVDIQQLVAADKAELQINAGEMVIGYYEGSHLDVECAVGAMMVVCEGNKNDYNYNLECGVGEIILGDETYSGLGQERQVQNGGTKVIEAECAMGQIQIEFPNSL